MVKIILDLFGNTGVDTKFGDVIIPMDLLFELSNNMLLYSTSRFSNVFCLRRIAN